MKLIALIFSVLILNSCSSILGESLSLTNGYRFSIGKGSPNARIFLVAGTDWTASHVKEIMAQKKLWLSLGYTEEQIVCYYFPPERDNKEIAAFDANFDDLRSCYLADADYLFSHIKEVAKSNPDSIYVYVSSVGRLPMTQATFKFDKKSDEERMREIIKLKDWSEPYSIEMLGYLEGRKYYSMSNVYKAHSFSKNNPKAASRYILTSTGLAEALSELPEKTKKVVVLQACYTEGFILPPQNASVKTLRGIKNLNVLTASSAQTTNAECKAGRANPLFGDAVEVALKRQVDGALLRKGSDVINQIQWKDIYDFASRYTFDQEKLLNREDYSLPKYYSN